MKKLVFLSLVLFIAGCSTGNKYDNLIVKDSKGNFYKLAHNIGDTYFVRPIDPDPVKEFKN